LSENWYGLSWATKLGEKVGFGVSPFLSFRSQNIRLQSVSQILAEDDTSMVLFIDNDLSYDTAALILKLGVKYEHKQLRSGATLTTPGLQLYGNGEVKSYRTLVDQGVLDGAPQTILGAGEVTGVSVTYHSPISLGAGLGYDAGKRAVHVSAEWFSGVDEYAVFETDTVVPQAGADTVTVSVTAQLKPVLNFGVGYSEGLGEHFVVYGSFTTDFSAIDPETENDIALADWDIYNLFTGAEFTFKGADFHLGLGYSFGSQERSGATRFRPSDAPVLLTEPPDRKVKYQALKGMIGIAFTIR
jgi:hypothetical protein